MAAEKDAMRDRADAKAGGGGGAQGVGGHSGVIRTTRFRFVMQATS